MMTMMMRIVGGLFVICCCTTTTTINGFTASPSLTFSNRRYVKTSVQTKSPSNVGPLSMSSSSSGDSTTIDLVLIRHGESTWNELNIFTGWADVPLSAKGEEEARQGGKLLKEGNFHFDICYTSTLKRAIKTLWIVLEQMDQMHLPIQNSWRLNERHYGALQGLNKQETIQKHGKEQVQIWRRSYDIPPPECTTDSEHFAGNDEKYANVPVELLPLAESLKLTEDRFMVEWEETLVPQIKEGKRILIAAHGNTLRALVKHLDDIPDDVIPGLNIPTGVPLVYTLDKKTLKPVAKEQAIEPLTGLYLGDPVEIRSRIGAVADQTK